MASQKTPASRAYRKKLQWKSNVPQFKGFISSVEINDRRMELLNGSPFAWALAMPEIPNIRSLIQNLFDNWDVQAKCFIFHNKHISFTRKDVALILGLPDQGDEVNLQLHVASTPLFVQHFTDVECSKTELENKMIMLSKQPSSSESDILFCQLVTLYFFVCVLFTTSSSISRLPVQSLIDCVDDFQNLGRYNWCKAVYDYMSPQLEAIGVALSLRQKPEGYEGNQSPMLKGFAHLLAVWMCEHLRIIEPFRQEALPRICRWKWAGSRVETIKAKIVELPPTHIYVDLSPSDLEEHLLSTDPLADVVHNIDQQIAVILCQDLPQQIPQLPQSCEEVGEDLAEAPQAKDPCVYCQEREAEIVNLHYLVESKDQIISDMEKQIRDLLDTIKTSASDTEILIAGKDKAIEDKDRILSVKDTIISEQEGKIKVLQSQIVAKDKEAVAEFPNRPITRAKRTAIKRITPPPAKEIEKVPMAKRCKQVKFLDDPELKLDKEKEILAQPGEDGEQEHPIPAAEVAGKSTSSKLLPVIVKQKSKVIKQATSYFKKNKDAVVAEALLKLRELKATTKPIWSNGTFTLDMQSLLGVFDWTGFRDGDCINAYFAIIANEAKTSGIEYWPSIFCAAGFIDMFESMSWEAFSLSSKTDAHKEIRYIFCPLNNSDDHWHLLIIDLQEGQYIHYNSLGASELYTSKFHTSVNFFKNLDQSLYDMWHPGLHLLMSREFQIYTIPGPTQVKSLDCALFVMRYAESLMYRRPTDFVQAGMREYSFHVGHKILTTSQCKT